MQSCFQLFLRTSMHKYFLTEPTAFYKFVLAGGGHRNQTEAKTVTTNWVPHCWVLTGKCREHTHRQTDGWMDVRRISSKYVRFMRLSFLILDCDYDESGRYDTENP